MNYETLLVEISGGKAQVTINRPKVLNALNEAVLKELTHCFEELSVNPQVRGIIVTGSGEKAFVAGADIAAMQDMTVLDASRFVQIGHKAMKAIESCPVPVIAAVNGFALGGGLELALSCDFIYAAKTARMGLPEVNLGIFPGFGGTQRLPRLIGKARAKELIFTAGMVTADEALAIGLVNKVVEAADLLTEANKTLDIILKKGPVALELVKKVVNEGTDLDLNSGLSMEATAFPMIFATEDKKEGVGAFLGKRPAQFNRK